MKMRKTSESYRKSLLILQSLWCKDKNCWINEYPTETELYILSKVIKDLTEWHKSLIQMVHDSKTAEYREIRNAILDTAAEIYSHLQIAKDRFRYLKSKHLVPIWITQIKNRLKLFIYKNRYN